MGTYNTELYFGELIGEIECMIEYDYTPAQAGRLYGPPENCYPDEPAEVDITDVHIQGITLSKGLQALLIGELNELEQLKIDIIEYEEEKAAERDEP